MTNKCNLRCKHCLTSSGESIPNELTTEEAQLVLTKFSSIGVTTIYFTGGEPFSRPDLLIILRKAAILELHTEVITNATMLNKRKLEIIKELGVKLGISLDGANSLIHDTIRGQGSFEKVIKVLKLCQIYEIPVQLYVVVTKDNIHQIKSLEELAKDYGCNGIHFNELNLFGRALKFTKELNPSPKESNELSNVIAKVTNEVFAEKMSKPDKRCWIDGSTLYMSADGNLYFCSEIKQCRPDFMIGNIRLINLQKRLGESNQFELLAYQDCCYSIQVSKHVTFIKNISPICPFILEKSVLIETLEQFYQELDLFYYGIEKYCYNCRDLDCMGYVWLLPQEAKRLYKQGIEVLEINNNINFLHPFVGKKKTDIEQFQPPCPWYKEKKCVIYHKRPLVCRMYPLGFVSEDDIIYLVLHLDCFYAKQKVKNNSFLEQVVEIFKRIHRLLLGKIIDTFHNVDYISKFPQGNSEYLRIISIKQFYSNFKK